MNFYKYTTICCCWLVFLVIVSAIAKADTNVGVGIVTPENVNLGIDVNAGGDVGITIDGTNFNSELDAINSRLNGPNDQFGSDEVANVIYEGVKYFMTGENPYSTAASKIASSFKILFSGVRSVLTNHELRIEILENTIKEADEERYCKKEYEMRLQYDLPFQPMVSDFEGCSKYICFNQTRDNWGGWCPAEKVIGGGGIPFNSNLSTTDERRLK